MWRPIELRKSSMTADYMFLVTKSTHYISHADQPHCWNGHTLSNIFQEEVGKYMRQLKQIANHTSYICSDVTVLLLLFYI